MGSVVWLTFLLYVRKFFVKILNLSNKFGRATWQILCLKSRKPCPGSMLVRKYINHCWKAFPCVWSIHMYVCFNMISKLIAILYIEDLTRVVISYEIY